MEENAAQPESQLNSQQNNELKATLFASTEGYLLLIGVALALIYTFWLGIRLLVSPDESQVLVGLTAIELTLGRGLAMTFGYTEELGLGHSTVIPICMILETIYVLIFYPLFVFSWRHLLVIKSLKKTFERVREAAETHKDKVQKYGVIGLFAFVWFPFWMTGPLVGSVIGFLLGLKLWLNMTVVLVGTYAAIVGWAFVLRQFHKQVASYSSYAAMVIIALVIFIILLVHLFYRTFHENKYKI